MPATVEELHEKLRWIDVKIPYLQELQIAHAYNQSVSFSLLKSLDPRRDLAVLSGSDIGNITAIEGSAKAILEYDPAPYHRTSEQIVSNASQFNEMSAYPRNIEVQLESWQDRAARDFKTSLITIETALKNQETFNAIVSGGYFLAGEVILTAHELLISAVDSINSLLTEVISVYEEKIDSDIESSWEPIANVLGLSGGAVAAVAAATPLAKLGATLQGIGSLVSTLQSNNSSSQPAQSAEEIEILLADEVRSIERFISDEFSEIAKVMSHEFESEVGKTIKPDF